MSRRLTTKPDAYMGYVVFNVSSNVLRFSALFPVYLGRRYFCNSSGSMCIYVCFNSNEKEEGGGGGGKKASIRFMSFIILFLFLSISGSCLVYKFDDYFIVFWPEQN